MKLMGKNYMVVDNYKFARSVSVLIICIVALIFTVRQIVVAEDMEIKPNNNLELELKRNLTIEGLQLKTLDETTKPKQDTIVENTLKSYVELRDIDYARSKYLKKFHALNGRKFKDSWYTHLEKVCMDNELPPELMLGIISGESSGNPKLVNPSSGATGLGQITYETFVYIKRLYFKNDGVTWRDMKNPYHNMKYTTKVMRDKIDRYGGFRRGIYSYGGCVKYKNKVKYWRYISKNVKSVTGYKLTEIERQIEG